MRVSLRLIAMFWPLLAALSPVATAENAAPLPDVRVLIDVSGSMKQNDPNNLRRPALELLLNLFPAEAEAGVWTFGQSVAVLAPHRPVTAGWRDQAGKRLGQITSSSLYTNIPEALLRATDDLGENDGRRRVSVILLTDGMVDVSKSPEQNAAARSHLLDDILPRLRETGVIVHTVALSNAADRELMERLAGDTRGLFAVAETADDLRRVFLQAFDAAAPAEQVPLAGNHFLVDSSIDELTALVFHTGGKPLVLASPDQRRHSFARHGDDLRWFQGRGFDLITVKKPFEGEWTVVADLEQGSRVTILSNLSLAVSRLPDGLFVDAETPGVTAALKQQGAVATEAELLRLVTFSASVKRQQDGREWRVALGSEPVPADGYYRAELPMLKEAGTYDIAIDADGKTFQRSQRQTVAVRLPFETRVDANEAIPAGHTVALLARNPAIDAAASAVTARIRGGDGKNREEKLSPVAEREWRLTLEPQENRLEVTFEVAGQYQGGDKFTYRSETLAIDRDGTQVVAPASPPAAVPAQPEPIAAQPRSIEPAPAAVAPAAAGNAGNNEGSGNKWLLYTGLGLGNLLILGLGVFAFRLIMGGSRSEVLEAADEEEAEASLEANPAPVRPGRRGNGPVLDLPDDAVDIDPMASLDK